MIRYFRGMHGLGDNIHQRAIIKYLIDRGDKVVLETSWPCVYSDFDPSDLVLVRGKTNLRTQNKNQMREANRFSTGSLPANAVQIRYSPQSVRQHMSVLGAMIESSGLNILNPDFRLTVPVSWINHPRFGGIIPIKPIMFLRPLNERKEWSGCVNRNPDHNSFATLFRLIRDRFFVVSVADFSPGIEWQAGEDLGADLSFHRGELSFEDMAALAKISSLVLTAPGFAMILAQAVETPTMIVFGGYENSAIHKKSSIFAPYLGIDPINPCVCFSHNHNCNKTIDLIAAKSKVENFVDAILT